MCSEHTSEQNNIDVQRHSAAHLLAMAVKALHPDARFGIGPVIENGFYYDIETDQPITEQELKQIEKRIKKFVGQKCHLNAEKSQ